MYQSNYSNNPYQYLQQPQEQSQYTSLLPQNGTQQQKFNNQLQAQQNPNNPFLHPQGQTQFGYQYQTPTNDIQNETQQSDNQLQVQFNGNTPQGQTQFGYQNQIPFIPNNNNTAQQISFIRNDLENQLEEIKRKYKCLEQEHDDLKSKYKKSQIDLETNQMILNNHKIQSDKEREEYKKKQKKKREYKQQQQLLQQQIKVLEDQQASNSTQQPNIPIIQENYQENYRFQELRKKLDAYGIEMQKLQIDKHKLEFQVKELLDNQKNKNNQYGQIEEDLVNQLEQERNYSNKRLNIINDLQKEMKELKNKLDYKDETLKEIQEQSKKYQFKINKQESNLQSLNQENEALKQQIQYLSNQLTAIQNKMLKYHCNEDDKKFIQEIEQQKKKFEEEQRRMKEEQRQQSKLNELREIQLIKEQKLKQKEQQAFLVVQEQNKKLAAKEMMKKMKQSHGVLELCFLIDVTGSMDPYKEQTIKCIQETRRNIKNLTNRDAICSAICYKDLCDKKRVDHLYYQLDFTEESSKFEQFLAAIKCGGGGDACEDIGGGLKQMCQNLNWTKPFRIAILICDAPGHGTRFNGGLNDDHPGRNSDIEDALKLVVDNEIMLIGLNFTKYTEKMFEEFIKIFQEHGRSDLFMTQDLAKVTKGDIWKEMVQLISNASVVATKTNNRGTLSKKAEHQKAKNKDSATEALCKNGNFFDFDKQDEVKKVECSFQVYTLKLTESSFKEHYKNIQTLKNEDHYQIQLQGIWECIRTQNPFAFGMMKQVFLMKKKVAFENELYVIKTPLDGKTYGSKQEAISECRSHLISQSFMRMYTSDIQNACNIKGVPNNYPNVVYSDILILEESPNSYWLAERFFQGEFVKYNNNYGFINDESQAPIYQFALGFSFYTFFKSNFDYIILDVQGVGNYFTDPAINTQKGHFDETDMGEDGISRFMVVFDMKKMLCKTILQDLLSIDADAN